jgi:ribosomal protein L10
VRFAARDLGAGELEALLTGPDAITFVRGDAAAAAKTLLATTPVRTRTSW